ncbi:MAG: alkaline phosphatase D family protein [Proteobacteria bacterium]|nr:alkaline phosphatase D family protein [Pseudomonadota bacterium]
MSISRRSLMKAGLVGASSVLLSSKDDWLGQITASDDCGVASGSPTENGFIIWTRIPGFGAEFRNEIDVKYEVSSSQRFERRSIVASGEVRTNAEKDFTVKVKVEGLESNLTFFYRFFAGSYVSEVGRATTLPPITSDLSSFSFGVVSCQKYSDGYYTALQALNAEDVRVCIHLGDHIYEQETGKVRSLDDPLKGEQAVSLEDYRKKYRHYLTDRHMRETRKRFTWIDLLDDHELFNDYAGDRDRNSQKIRVKAAYQAYCEYMPVDFETTIDASDRPSVHSVSSIKIGSLIQFFRMDQRQFRQPNPCSRAFVTKRCEAAENANHTMLGHNQFDWLVESLGESAAKWKILLSEVMFTPLTVKFLGMMKGMTDQNVEIVSKKLNLNSPSFANNQTFLNLDAWDGYPAEREKLLDFVANERIPNVVALTGDIHAGVHAKVLRNGQPSSATPVFYEIVTTSITSSTLGEKLGPIFGSLAGNIISKSNAHVEWSNVYSHGYSVVTVTPFEFKVRQMAVSTIDEPNASLSVSKVFTLKDGFNL